MRTFCTYPALVQHVSVAVTGARGDSTSVAYATEVHDLAAVCNAVASRAARVVPSTYPTRVCHVPPAIAFASWDARASTESTLIDCVSSTIAFAGWDTGAIADATRVKDHVAIRNTVTSHGHFLDDFLDDFLGDIDINYRVSVTETGNWIIVSVTEANGTSRRSSSRPSSGYTVETTRGIRIRVFTLVAVGASVT